jgi:hypothetical protein
MIGVEMLWCYRGSRSNGAIGHNPGLVAMQLTGITMLIAPVIVTDTVGQGSCLLDLNQQGSSVNSANCASRGKGGIASGNRNAA